MDYVESAAKELLSTLMGVLRKVRPGRLASYTLYQDDSGAWVEARFVLERWPEVTYELRRGLKDATGTTPAMDPASYAGVVLGAVVEATAKHPPSDKTLIAV